MNIHSAFLHVMHVNDACLRTAVFMYIDFCMFVLYFAFIHDLINAPFKLVLTGVYKNPG